MPSESETADSAILDLMAIIPFGIYPSTTEAQRAIAAVGTLHVEINRLRNLVSDIKEHIAAGGTLS